MSGDADRRDDPGIGMKTANSSIVASTWKGENLYERLSALTVTQADSTILKHP